MTSIKRLAYVELVIQNLSESITERNIKMVARIWHGKTSIENYKNYTDFLREIAIPDYKKQMVLRDLLF